MSMPKRKAIEPGEELLTREEFATRCGVHPRTVGHWLKADIPRVGDGKAVRFPWERCRDWRDQQLRNDKRTTRHTVADLELRKKIAEAKLRQALSDAENADLDLARKRGELIPVAFMTEEFRRIGSRIRTKLLQLPAAWATRLGACATYTDRRLVLLEAVNELMPEMQELCGDDVTPITAAEAAD
jgi:phage terminase Nu1 subunit (DNA packaging protein)